MKVDLKSGGGLYDFDFNVRGYIYLVYCPGFLKDVHIRSKIKAIFETAEDDEFGEKDYFTIAEDNSQF